MIDLRPDSAIPIRAVELNPHRPVKMFTLSANNLIYPYVITLQYRKEETAMTISRLVKCVCTMWILLSVLFSVDVPRVQAAENEDEIGEVLIGEDVRGVEIGGDYLWLSTGAGVSRYDFDAKTWDYFTTKDGLVSNKVNCIGIEWKQGVFGRKPSERVWFGTDSGLSVFDMKRNEWKSYTVKDGLVANKIRCISARGDWIWVGTEKGASAFQLKKNRWRSYTSFKGVKNPSVTAIHHDSKYVWIGTPSGLSRYNIKHDEWEYFTKQIAVWVGTRGGIRSIPNPKRPGSIMDNLGDSVNDIEASGDSVYVATKSGLIRIANKKFETDTNLHIQDMAYGKLKTLQPKPSEPPRGSSLGRNRRSSHVEIPPAGTEHERAMRSFKKWEAEAWKTLGWEIISPSKSVQNRDTRALIPNQIEALAVSAGRVWMATKNGLLNYDTKLGTMQWFHQDMGLASNQINSLAVRGNTIWIGTIHGLSQFHSVSGRWRTYREEKALPSAYVLAIGEDTEGVWLATQKAMSRFNPRTERWKSYTNEDGLGVGTLTCLDVVGNYLWIGSDQGISRYDKSNESWDYFRAARSGLVADEITKILVDGKSIWVGTTRGLNRYDNSTQEWTAFSSRFGLSNDKITDLAAGSQHLWVGTGNGLSRYDKSAQKWHNTPAFEGKTVLALGESDGTICVATESGVHLHDDETRESWRKLEIGRDVSIDVVALDDGALWGGGWRNLIRYDLESGQTREFTDDDAPGLSTVRIHDIHPSYEFVWVATDGGIYRYNKRTDSWWAYAPSRERARTEILVAKDIRAIVINEDYAFFGTPRGISRFDKTTDTWLNYTTRDGLRHNYVSSLLLVGNELWCGTYGGVSRYNLILDQWNSLTTADGLCDNRVNALARDGNYLWIATQSGVSRFDTKAGTWQTLKTADGLPDDVVWSVALDGTGIWFGTNRGAAQYSHNENRWTIYTTDDGLINNIVTSISVGEKYIFLATPGGVTMYDKEVESLTPYSQADGLAAQDAKSIGSKEKYHWIGTSQGITLYNQVTDLSRDFSEAQGLPSNDVQVIAIDGDEIWFGTNAGLARHHWVRGDWITYSEAPEDIESTASDLIDNNIKAVVSDGDYLWVGTRLGLAKYDKISHTWRIANLAVQTAQPNQRIADLEQRVTASVQAIESALQASNPTRTRKVYVDYHPETAREKAYAAIQRMAEKRTPQPSDPTVPSPFIAIKVEFPPMPTIRAIAPVLGQLWLGTEAGVIVYNKATNAATQIHPLLPWVRDIQYRDGKVWVLSDNQIAIFDHKAKSWTLITNGQIVEHTRVGKGLTERLETTHEDFGIYNCAAMAFLNNQLWLGRENGLRIIEIDSRMPKLADRIEIPPYLESSEITALASDPENMWVGTRQGVFRYYAPQERWETYTVLDGLIGNDISTITVGNYVWVGTAGEGLSRYNRAEERWDGFNIDDGLSDNNIRSINLDGKYVWVGTFSAGVCRFDLSTELWTTFRTEDYRAFASER